MDSADNTAPTNAGPARSSRMAFAAIILSVFAFILPFGVAAVVLGHLAARRIDASRGMLNGKATARAALIIAYLQMSLVLVVALVGWQLFHLTVRDFRRDALVQRVFRDADSRAPLDATSAREEEITAQALTIQIVAIQDRHYRVGQGYLCSIGELVQAGIEGTPAEKEAFNERLRQSAYNFELSVCSSGSDGSLLARYDLTGVPRTPRMPTGSATYCADETGAVKQMRGGTSVDCFDHGYVIVKPAKPDVENPPSVASPVK
ncbi:MAG TPA: DUF4190 domain-containing protein [Terriglobales bacterium]